MMDVDLARRLRLCASLFATASLLAACGGGGGGGSSPPPPSPPPAPAVSGLVPTAPTAGAILEADATTLRVLRPGATWTYHGTDTATETANGVTSYVDVVTQTAAGAGVTEHSTNSLNGGVDDEPEQAVGGVVSSVQALQPVPNQAADQVNVIELRSPVRVDDQVTIYDRHFADAGQDFDGDGKNDSLDVAIWAHVVGTETIDLPQRRGIVAIRVDTTLEQRVHLSSTNQDGPVEQTVRSVWYARGIGIVKVQLDTPTGDGPLVREIVIEQLDTWDGLTEGLGYRAAQSLVIASGESAGQGVPGPMDAVTFDDHAVILGLIPGSFPADGATLTALDRDGKVLSSTNQHGAAVAGGFMNPQQLLRMGNELRLVAQFGGDVGIVGFDAQGQARTLAPVTLLPAAAWVSDADNQASQFAASGNRLWMMWLARRLDADMNTIADLTLQSFDSAGNAASAPVVLVAGINPEAIRAMKLSAASDRTIASWNVSTVGGNQFYAVFDSTTGALLASKTVTPAGPIPAGFGAPTYIGLTPLALGPGLVMLLDSSATYGQLAGVSLDGSYDIVAAANDATLESEVISPSWMQPVTPVPLYATASGHVVIASGGSVRLWEDDATDTSVTTFSDLVPGSASLASTGTLSLLARVPGAAVGAVLPWSDRILYIGGSSTQEGSTASSTVVWRLPS